MRLLVVGGTGLVGTTVVRALAARGHEVRVVVRHPPSRSALRVPDAEYVSGDVARPETLRGAADGCAAVIHVAGIARERRPHATYERVNVAGTRHVLAESKRAHVPLVVYLSSLGAQRGASPYHRSKRAAEALVREYDGKWLVLRPGNVYGCGGGLVALYMQMVRMLPVIPGVGKVDQPFQPVCVDDLGEAICRVVERPDLAGQTLELAGDDVTSQRALHEQISGLVARRPPLARIPAWMVKAGVHLGALLGIDAPIGPDQVIMMQEGNLLEKGSTSALRDVLGITPTSLAQGLHDLSRATPEQLPADGSGPMRFRRWWVDIEGARCDAAALLDIVRCEFTTLVPNALLEIGAERSSDLELETGALLSLTLPLRGHVQVQVEEVTSQSVTCATLQGHPLSGVIRLLSEQRGARIHFEVQTLDHPHSAFDRLLMSTIGTHLKRITWRAMLRAIVARSGGEAPAGIEAHSEVLDAHHEAHIDRWIRRLIRRRADDVQLGSDGGEFTPPPSEAMVQ